MCLGGHGGCYGPPKLRLPPPDLDFLPKKSINLIKIKEKILLKIMHEFPGG